MPSPPPLFSMADRRRPPVTLALVLAVVIAGSAARADDPARLGFGDLYASVGVLGLQFSDKARALAGKPVAMRGFMAPPLKAEASFFVLTREPVSLCPFCQSDADWPSDIVVVSLHAGVALTANTEPIEVRGMLEIGSRTDPHTGFVSQVRIVDARLRRL